MYNKTMLALNEMKSLSGHITNLGKISSQTEDEQLKSYLLSVIRVLQSCYQLPGVKKSMPFSVMQNYENSSHVQDIVGYCSMFIAQEKPEWQVLAEKNGWRYIG